MNHLLRLATLVLLMLAGAPAGAALSCSIQSSPSVNFGSYSPNSTYLTSPNALRQMSFTALCTRTAANDPTVVTLGASNGSWNSGQGNNMRLVASGTNYNLAYDFFKESACANAFRDNNASRISATIPSTPLNTPLQVTFDYWACIRTAQALTGYPTGTFTDNVTMTLRTSNTPLASTSILVSVFAPGQCTLSNGPSNITFLYTAFGSEDFRTTSFNANCTNGMPYTLSVSPAAGVVGGLRYSLGMSSGAPGSPASLGTDTLNETGNATGTRVYYINGLMPAAQPGQNGAVVPQPHTLTVTY